MAAADQERRQLLADAKQGADQYREQTRRAVDEASQQRIRILEQLVGVYSDLEGFPAALESAYQERKNPAEASIVVPLATTSVVCPRAFRRHWVLVEQRTDGNLHASSIMQLCRSAMEGSARTIWILGNPDRDVRRDRALNVLVEQL